MGLVLGAQSTVRSEGGWRVGVVGLRALSNPRKRLPSWGRDRHDRAWTMFVCKVDAVGAEWST